MKKFLTLIVTFLITFHAAAFSYTYDLAICAIFRDEAPYLKEWIEFHKLVGVQHFYLYNHLSTDHYLSILQPYINSGEVELVDWTFPENLNFVRDVQPAAYRHALEKAKNNVKWLAILDTDEFLFPVNDDNLITFLARYEKVAALCVNWQLYGTSDFYEIPPNKLLIEMLTKKAHTNYPENKHVKSIVRPEFVKTCVCPHTVKLHQGFFQVNSDCKPFKGPFSPYVQVDKIRINHYWTRDERFFYENKIDRRRQLGENMDQAIDRAKKLNKVEDLAIYKYLTQMRKKNGV